MYICQLYLFNYISLSNLRLVNYIYITYAYWCSGSAFGNGSHPSYKFKKPITLRAGKNDIALLSMTVGLQVGFSLVITKFHSVLAAGS